MHRTNGKADTLASALGAPSTIVSPIEQNGCEFETALLAMAGHDLRQPLQIIQYVQERLNDGLRTRAELRLLRINQNAIDRMSRQLDQLLDALRVVQHGKHVQLSPVGLGALLQDTCREHELTAVEKGIQIRMVPTRSWVMSDALLLGAVLRNLVDNAIKYTEPGGRILLGCRHAQQIVRIDVLDTGTAFPTSTWKLCSMPLLGWIPQELQGLA